MKEIEIDTGGAVLHFTENDIRKLLNLYYKSFDEYDLERARRSHGIAEARRRRAAERRAAFDECKKMMGALG